LEIIFAKIIVLAIAASLMVIAKSYEQATMLSDPKGISISVFIL
jgi:hypothetical protein